jgi:hypothetical protein
MRKKGEREFISSVELLKLGWTKDMVNELMPEADESFKSGIRGAKIENYYERKRVERIESTTRFRKMRMLTLTELKKRGWSESMIRNLLGQPFETKQNPWFKNGADMKLYSLARVESVESTMEFKEALLNKERRSTIALMANNRKQELGKEPDQTMIPSHLEDDYYGFKVGTARNDEDSLNNPQSGH